MIEVFFIDHDEDDVFSFFVSFIIWSPALYVSQRTSNKINNQLKYIKCIKSLWGQKEEYLHLVSLSPGTQNFVQFYLTCSHKFPYPIDITYAGAFDYSSYHDSTLWVGRADSWRRRLQTKLRKTNWQTFLYIPSVLYNGDGYPS